MTVHNPQRIQRKRTKGWSVQAEAERLGCSVDDIVYVGRGSRWGNPFPVSKFGIRLSMKAYKNRMIGMERIGVLESFLSPLRGKNLMCWCPLDRPCHADVLLGLANQTEVGDGTA